MTEIQSNTDQNPEQCEDLINNGEPIDALNPDSKCYEQYKNIFNNLQGGTIKSYGRNYSLYIFIQFDETKVDEVKQWIGGEIANSVTSTWTQLEDTKTYKKTIERLRRRGLDPSIYIGELRKNFFLSFHGYKTLGFSPDKLPTKMDANFHEGMMKEWENNYHLNNPPEAYWYNPPERWDVGGKDKIDALILLTHDGLQDLKNEAITIIGQCEKFGKVVACEAGYRLKEPNGHYYIGPFGFADGISQPLFLKSDYDEYLNSQNIKQGTKPVWDTKASLSLVLVKDPFVDEPYSFGSYCVWQKLETDYFRFKTKVECLADQFKFGRELERASALVVGRFRDGTPLALSGKSDQSLGDPNINNFNYANDKGGGKCPLQAHIRKVNPRNELTPSLDKTRIFRAGITYFDDPTMQQTPELSISQLCLNKLDYLNNVVSKQSLKKNIESISGLLFVCFQHSILSQFSKLQEEWADDRKFPLNDEPKYLDPLIGHPATSSITDPPIQQEWSKEWSEGGEKDSVSYSFYGCVKNRGGEFLFAPSISFLKKLS